MDRITGGMQLVDISGIGDDDWNERIAPFDTVMFYHHSAWLRFLEKAGRGAVHRYQIVDDGEVLGYFPGLLTRKGPFRIFGSPLSATMSEYMGPIADSGFPVDRFLTALDRLCRDLRVQQLEIGSPLFEPEPVVQRGFEASRWMTYRIPLGADIDRLWANLNSRGRNRIRRGEKNGLIAEDATDAGFVGRHYAQVAEVFQQQKLAPPFAREDFDHLFESLKPAGLVYTIEVKDRASGEVVASGIFPHDGRHVYSLSTASPLATRHLCPNELLHWSVMKMAGAAGLRRYSVGDSYRVPRSGGVFKKKFNGRYEPVYRYVRHYSAVARFARRIYIRMNQVKRRMSALAGPATTSSD